MQRLAHPIIGVPDHKLPNPIRAAHPHRSFRRRLFDSMSASPTKPPITA
jgi:hypothetical protein